MIITEYFSDIREMLKINDVLESCYLSPIFLIALYISRPKIETIFLPVEMLPTTIRKLLMCCFFYLTVALGCKNNVIYFPDLIVAFFDRQ